MIRITLSLLTLLTALTAAAARARVAAPSADVFGPEDVTVSGRRMHHVTADGEPVAVVVGDFALEIGRRRFSGRGGVFWVREEAVGGRVLRTIELYVEGDARVEEPDGTITATAALWATIRHSGALRASVTSRSTGAVADLPLYRRAVARRAAADAPLEEATATAPEAETAETAEAPPVPPERPTRVSFRADETRLLPVRRDGGRTFVEISDGGREPREVALAGVDASVDQILLCTGDVYVADIAPDAAWPVEIQADAAVLFVADTAAADAGVDTALSAVAMTGAYLEGDVRVAAGDQTLRSDRLFFDFVDYRAILLDAVYHTIQPQRNIPIYVRADEVLLRTEWHEDLPVASVVHFRDARISTSEFYAPTYHLGAAEATIRDATARDAAGRPAGPIALDLWTRHATFNVRGVPITYWPATRARVLYSELPLRRIQVGDHGPFGLGVETDWRLFDLLGLREPDGYDAELSIDAYEEAAALGLDTAYARDDYAGYILGYGVYDREGEDDFGGERENIPAPEHRGRWLWRHRQFLGDDWQLQAEFSYLCDENFLEAYFRDEFYAGKPQETLLYAKKQRDHWAFTALLQPRINDWLTTTEVYPDVGVWAMGLPVGPVTPVAEAHVGVLRLRDGNELDAPAPSDGGVFRADGRAEVDLPLRWGPVRMAPFTFGRLTYWSDRLDGSDLTRALGGGGVRATMSFWQVYNDARSRLLDVHRLRHIVTAEVAALGVGSNVRADELIGFSPDIEEHLDAFSGVSVGVRQRWQTYRGPAGARRAVDLARANVAALFFDDAKDPGPSADGRLFFSRPEYAITRNAINGDVLFNLSDATALLGDVNYDLNDDEVGLADLGVAVQRDPRYRWYLGTRYIDDLDSWVWTGGVNYQLSEKYEVSAFQQYDIDFDDGRNLQSRVSLIRKFPRWYVAVSVVVDGAPNDTSVLLTLWPEGIPEWRLGGSRVNTWRASELN
ncbi:MAG: hypothetical protein ACOC7R_00645 [Planctomycetota bacterium]